MKNSMRQPAAGLPIPHRAHLRGSALFTLLITVTVVTGAALYTISSAVSLSVLLKNRLRDLHEAFELQAVLFQHISSSDEHRLELEPQIHAVSAILRSDGAPVHLPVTFQLDGASTPVTNIVLDFENPLFAGSGHTLCSSDPRPDMKSALGLTAERLCIYSVTHSCISESLPLPSLLDLHCPSKVRPLIALPIVRERTIYRTKTGELRALDTAGATTILSQPLMAHAPKFVLTRLHPGVYELRIQIGAREKTKIFVRAISPLSHAQNLQLVFR